MENYITISVYNYQHEIEVIKLLLEQENIRFYFENENILSVVPLYSYAIGGIKLNVHIDDEEKAKEILKIFE
ncbi:MAG: putative signal transducing protein [Fusobacteriaceae bacterium]